MPRLVSGRGRTDSPGPQYVKCRSFKWMTTLSSLRSPAAAASTSITPSPFAPLISASLSTSSCTRKRSTYAALWFVFPRPARAAPRCWKSPPPDELVALAAPHQDRRNANAERADGGGTLVKSTVDGRVEREGGTAEDRRQARARDLARGAHARARNAEVPA